MPARRVLSGWPVGLPEHSGSCLKPAAPVALLVPALATRCALQLMLLGMHVVQCVAAAFLLCLADWQDHFNCMVLTPHGQKESQTP